MDTKWLEWAKRLQAIAQNGLTYTQNPFDIERYKALRLLTAEIMATYSSMEPSYVLDLFAAEVGYATPKVDVRGAVFCGDTLLFVREREDGCWTLPGGWADIGDSQARSLFEKSMKNPAIIPVQSNCWLSMIGIGKGIRPFRITSTRSSFSANL